MFVMAGGGGGVRRGGRSRCRHGDFVIVGDVLVVVIFSKLMVIYLESPEVGVGVGTWERPW